MKKENKNERFPTRFSLLRDFLRGSVRWFVLSMAMAVAVTAIDFVNPRIIGYAVAWMILAIALLGAACRYLFKLMEIPPIH